MRLPVNQALPLAALLLVAGCGGGGEAVTSTVQPLPATGPAADYPMVLGDPFTIEGVTYSPNNRLNYDDVGYAGIGTDGGAGVSIAHRTLPMPSYAEITALDSGKTVLVRVERRGPMTNDRLVELSPGAASQLGLTADKSPIRIRRVNPPEAERAKLRSGEQAPARMDTPASLLTVLRRKLDPALAPGSPQLPASEAVVSAGPAAVPMPKVSPTPAAPPAGPRVADKAPHPAPEPKTEVVAPAQPSPEPTPAVKAAPRPKTAQAPRAAVKPEPRAATARAAKERGSFIVQVGAYANAGNARSAAAKTGGRVSPMGRLSRVTAGPFTTRAQADAALAKARAAGYSDARIQRAD